MSESTELQLPENMRLDDAPADTGAEALPERPRSAHSEAMERIARHYEETQLAHELDAGAELARDALERDGGEAQEEPAAQPAHAQPVASPQSRTITLQGQQFAVTEEQHQRLAEIGALANLAMQQPRQAEQQQQPQPQHVQQQAYRPQQGAPLLDREAAAGIVQRLAYGGQEDGIAAVQELAQNIAARHPQIDPVQLGAYATQQALASIQFQQNLNQIGQEYPDVFENQTRAYVAAIELTQLRQQDALLGRQRPDIELYRDACQRVRSAMTPQRNGRGDTSTDRLERKRAAPRNPTAVSRSAGMGPAEPRPPSASQIIDQMRKARGQLV